jgi:hypothetical protein
MSDTAPAPSEPALSTDPVPVNGIYRDRVISLVTEAQALCEMAGESPVLQSALQPLTQTLKALSGAQAASTAES